MKILKKTNQSEYIISMQTNNQNVSFLPAFLLSHPRGDWKFESVVLCVVVVCECVGLVVVESLPPHNTGIWPPLTLVLTTDIKTIYPFIALVFVVPYHRYLTFNRWYLPGYLTSFSTGISSPLAPVLDLPYRRYLPSHITGICPPIVPVFTLP